MKSSNSPWPGIEELCQISTVVHGHRCEADTDELYSLVSIDSNAYRSLSDTALCFVVTIACRRQLRVWNPLDRLHSATEYWLQCRISMCLISTFETLSIKISPINLYVNLALEAAFRRQYYRRFIGSWTSHNVRMKITIDVVREGNPRFEYKKGFDCVHGCH